MPDPTFVSAKESDVAASTLYTRSTTATIAALAAGATQAGDLIASPGAGFAIVIDYFDWVPTSADKTQFALVDEAGEVIHIFNAGSSAAAITNYHRAIHRRVAANKYVRIKNTDGALALAITCTIGYRIVTDP